MLEFHNVRVYDLRESVISCRNAMRMEIPVYTDEEFEKGLTRARKLVKASADSPNVKCHDNFLTGIRVSFDMKYSQYITKQMQRYHWFDYVSSSSMMHKLVAMPIEESCNKYVSRETKMNLKTYIDRYNAINESYEEGMDIPFIFGNGERIVAKTKGDALYYAYMQCISNAPMGMELFTRVSTNYKQLQTMYWQRKNHKLREDWGAFVEMVKNLPYSELIIGETDEK